MAEKNWGGTTYGNGLMHRWLIGLLKIIDIRVIYVLAYIFAVTPTLFKPGFRFAYRFFRERFPTLQHSFRILCNSLSIDMRMTEYQLVAQFVTNVCYIELLFLLAYPTIEHDVQQNVAQLLAYLTLVVTYQSIAKFVRLLNRIRTQTVVRLLSIPWTFLTKSVHHIQQTPEGLHFLFFRMHSFHSNCKGTHFF